MHVCINKPAHALGALVTLVFFTDGREPSAQSPLTDDVKARIEAKKKEVCNPFFRAVSPLSLRRGAC